MYAKDFHELVRQMSVSGELKDVKFSTQLNGWRLAPDLNEPETLPLPFPADDYRRTFCTAIRRCGNCPACRKVGI